MTTTQQLDVNTAAPESPAGVDIPTDPTADGESRQVQRAGGAHLLHAVRRAVHALAESGRTPDVPGAQPLIGPNGNVMWTTAGGPGQGTSHRHLSGVGR